MNCISFKQNILNTKFNLINDYNCDFFKKHIYLKFKLLCYNCINKKKINVFKVLFNLNCLQCIFKKHSIKLFFKLNCYNKSHPKYFKLLEFYSDLSLGK
jgi:hypothetical protein